MVIFTNINVGKYDHVSPVLKELGWLPIKEYLQYRDAVLVHKCMYIIKHPRT